MYLKNKPTCLNDGVKDFFSNLNKRFVLKAFEKTFVTNN